MADKENRSPAKRKSDEGAAALADSDDEFERIGLDDLHKDDSPKRQRPSSREHFSWRCKKCLARQPLYQICSSSRKGRKYFCTQQRCFYEDKANCDPPRFLCHDCPGNADVKDTTNSEPVCATMARKKIAQEEDRKLAWAERRRRKSSSSSTVSDSMEVIPPMEVDRFHLPECAECRDEALGYGVGYYVPYGPANPANAPSVDARMPKPTSSTSSPVRVLGPSQSTVHGVQVPAPISSTCSTSSDRMIPQPELEMNEHHFAQRQEVAYASNAAILPTRRDNTSSSSNLRAPQCALDKGLLKAIRDYKEEDAGTSEVPDSRATEAEQRGRVSIDPDLLSDLKLILEDLKDSQKK